MGVLDRFERGVERLVSAAFAKAFRSEVKPVEIASNIRREMDDRAVAVSRGRTVVPNEFTVHLATADLEQVESFGSETLAEEMSEAATQHASSQRYSFVGPVTVAFAEGAELQTGRFKVDSTTRKGAVAPATSARPSERHPIIDIDGERYLLTGPVTVIGRGSEADVVVDDSGISRKHLRIEVTEGGVIARDLGSTNGSFVEGHRIEAATLVDGNTITVGRTRILFWSGDDQASG